MNRHRLLVLGPLLAMGCGGTDSKPLTPNEFVSQYAQEVCDAVAPACLVPVATCTAIQVADRTQQAQDAAAKGRSFMPDAAQTCLDKVSSVFGSLQHGAVALEPADFEEVGRVCDQVYRGVSRANEPCTMDADCIGGLICDKFLCGTRSVVLQGAGCANVGETCPPGSFCGASASGALLCQTRIGLGGACDTLRCANSICVAQLGFGEACATDLDCSSRFCEPYAHLCAEDIRFAHHSEACVAMGGDSGGP
jgi:hypothetical protein